MADIYNLYVGEGGLDSVDFDSAPATTFAAGASSGDLVGFGFAASQRYTLVLRPETTAGLETPDISARTEFVTDADTEWTGLRPDPIQSLTAKVVADGAIRLTWYHRIFDGATPDDFEVNYGTTPSATGNTEVVTYSGTHRYTVSIDPGNENTHWFPIVARTAGLDSDPVRTLGVTPDDTAPDAPTATATTTWQPLQQ